MSSTILIIDDVSDWRNMLAGLVEDVYPEFKVVTAASIEEAKQQLTHYDFDLAIIDIRLDESDESNTDGISLAQFIQTHYAQTRALIITSYPNLETVKQTMQPDPAGVRLAADYIEKDKLHAELLPRISAILGSHR